jgi:cell division transport system permease protein
LSLNLIYSFREGLKGLSRARIASAVTISTIAVTLILLDLFMILTLNVQKIIRTFKAQMFLEVFFDSTLNEQSIEGLKQTLMQMEGIEKIVYISTEQALDRFRKEFGEDPLSLLGENPLPPSFQIRLKPNYRSSEKADIIARDVQKNPFVDEVVYHGRFFRMVEKYSRIVLLVDIGLVLIIFAAALFLVSNTLRLTILAQSKSIQIMRLIGATQGFIRRPYLIQGVFQGVTGGAVCTLVIWGLFKIISWKFTLQLESMLLFLGGPIILGGILGFLGSQFGLRKYLNA